MPAEPENRVTVWLLQIPPGMPLTVTKCAGVALHAEPHFPPLPHSASDVHGSPMLPAVQNWKSSLHATSPLPFGTGGSVAVHVASSGATHPEPGQSASELQYPRKFPVAGHVPPPGQSALL